MNNEGLRKIQSRLRHLSNVLDERRRTGTLPFCVNGDDPALLRNAADFLSDWCLTQQSLDATREERDAYKSVIFNLRNILASAKARAVETGNGSSNLIVVELNAQAVEDLMTIPLDYPIPFTEIVGNANDDTR